MQQAAAEPIQIRPASPDDCPAVAELHVACWQKAYEGIVPADYLASLSVEKRAASWRQVLAEARSELLLAWVGGAVAGFVSFGPSRDADANGRGEVWAIYVSPNAWSAGVGRALWQAARERLGVMGYTPITLWVIVGNQRAIRFYEAAGFRMEPGSEKSFEIGSSPMREVRYVFDEASGACNSTT